MKSIVLIFFVTLLSISEARALTFSVNQDSVAHDIGTTILTKAYNRIGITPQFISMPLQQSLEMSNAGQIDGEIVRIKKITEMYPNLVEIPVIISFVEGIAFSKDYSMEINSWEDLKPYKIAIIEGVKFIEKGTEGMNRILVDGYKEAFTLLKSDEVDIVVSTKTSGVFIAHKLRYRDIKPIGSVLQKLDLYHFLHKKNAHIIPQLTPVLQTMKKSGEISYIRGQYLNNLLGL